VEYSDWIIQATGRIDSPVNYGYLFTWITHEIFSLSVVGWQNNKCVFPTYNGVHLSHSWQVATLLIFKVKGQCHQVKFLPRNILVNTRINILQWILTKLGTYLVLRRVWNPIDFQGHWVKFLPHNIPEQQMCLSHLQWGSPIPFLTGGACVLSVIRFQDGGRRSAVEYILSP
jgi:hypothetical protein